MKYDELRKLAEAATPGPWRWIEPHSVRRRYDQIFEDADAPIAAIEGLFSMRHRNGAYIAAASPDVILALLVERELYRTALRSLMEPRSSEGIPLFVAALLDATDDEERRPEPWEQEAHIEYSSEAAEEAAP